MRWEWFQCCIYIWYLHPKKNTKRTKERKREQHKNKKPNPNHINVGDGVASVFPFVYMRCIPHKNTLMISNIRCGTSLILFLTGSWHFLLCLYDTWTITATRICGPNMNYVSFYMHLISQAGFLSSCYSSFQSVGGNIYFYTCIFDQLIGCVR